MTVLPERDLFGFRPKTSIRQNTDVRKSKHQLAQEIFNDAKKQFSQRYEAKYGHAPKANFKNFSKDFTTALNYLMSTLSRDQQIAWGSLQEFTSQDTHGPLLIVRKRVAIGFVNWLFEPGNRFNNICPGDLVSDHWWTEYTQCLYKALKRHNIADGWEKDDLSETEKKIQAVWSDGGGWND